jgi:hypothetical protein
MHVSYVDFICDNLKKFPVGMPIYTSRIAEQLGATYRLDSKKASAATAVAFKRVMDGNILSELRCYQKGIYYRTSVTPFGEVEINKEQLIADKYLLPDIGYNTGFTFMHDLGLTSQMPRQRTLVTNAASDCVRLDKKLDVIICPPKTAVTSENKFYLQVLDALELIDKAPVDDVRPYETVARHIKRNQLDYGTLLAFANDFYNKATVLHLASTASAGETI